MGPEWLLSPEAQQLPLRTVETRLGCHTSTPLCGISGGSQPRWRSPRSHAELPWDAWTGCSKIADGVKSQADRSYLWLPIKGAPASADGTTGNLDPWYAPLFEHMVQYLLLVFLFCHQLAPFSWLWRSKERMFWIKTPFRLLYPSPLTIHDAVDINIPVDTLSALGRIFSSLL